MFLRLILFIIAAAVIVGCSEEPPAPHSGPSHGSRASSIALESDLEHFCGDCHPVPKPESFPKDAWYEEVAQGYRFYRQSGRRDLKVPAMAEVVDYFRERAPESISLPQTEFSTSTIAFRQEVVPAEGDPGFAGISHLFWYPPADTKTPGTLFTTDMKSGWVGRTTFAAQNATWTPLARLSHPAHITPADMDHDGRTDYLVAELGSFSPEDHDKGQVVWLHSASENGETEVTLLCGGLGRVADVEPGDFDADGDLDLIVAEFGWQTTGRIVLLERISQEMTAASFELRVIDQRHGTIHVPVLDFDGDGNVDDFVALISQEHERVVAFLGQEHRSDGDFFESQELFAAPDPSFGSSGIQLTDLDGDGDIDVLYTNGDTLDSFYLKPFHAIRWLENQGTVPFVEHELLNMPGVYRAEAGDLDGDGDLDIAACAALPDRIHSTMSDDRFVTLAWLEQTAPGTFTPRRLDRHPIERMALTMGDFDADGDLDIAVGGHGPTARSQALSIWWNEGRKNEE